MRKNWEEIRNKYIYGVQRDGKLEFPTVQDLADEYNTSLATVGEHSSKEGWVNAREQYLKERRIKGEQKVVEKFTDEMVQFDIQIFDKAKVILKELDKLDILKPNDAFTLTNTLKSLKDVAKSILGEGNSKDDNVIQIVVSSEEGKVLTEKITKGERT